MSVAANVAHSYVPPDGAPPGWQPQLGAVIGAVFWPVALLVALELLARVEWPEGNGWLAVRFGGLVPVAAVAALVSYRHMSGLLGWYGEDPVTATVGPLAVDGLMVMGAGALLATASRRRIQPASGLLVDAALASSAGTFQAAPAAAVRPVNPVAVAAAAGRPAALVVAAPDPAKQPAKVDLAETAARQWQTRHGTLPSASQLAAETGIAQRTCGDALKRLRGPSKPARRSRLNPPPPPA